AQPVTTVRHGAVPVPWSPRLIRTRSGTTRRRRPQWQGWPCAAFGVPFKHGGYALFDAHLAVPVHSSPGRSSVTRSDDGAVQLRAQLGEVGRAGLDGLLSA